MSRLTPRFLVRVEGTELQSDITSFIDEVEYEEGEDLAARITFSVSNHNFKFSDSKVFAEGNTVDLWMGYANGLLSFMNRGVIVQPNDNFPRDGMSVMQITAYDKTISLMSEDKRGRFFRDRRDSDIAAAVFREAGFTPSVTPTRYKRDRMRKRGTSKWQFLTRLAKSNGFEVLGRYDRSRGWTGYFVDPATTSQVNQYTFQYGPGEIDTTLLSFEPDFSIRPESTEIQVVYIDPKDRKRKKAKIEVRSGVEEKVRFVGVSGARPIREGITNGPKVKLKVFGQTFEMIADRQFNSLADARRFAAAWWARRERDFVFGRGVIVGSPDVRYRDRHYLSLPSPRYSGLWRFTMVRQRMSRDGFYETEFTASKVVENSPTGDAISTSEVSSDETDQ